VIAVRTQSVWDAQWCFYICDWRNISCRSGGSVPADFSWMSSP